MRFVQRHRIPAPLARVERAVLEPEYQDLLAGLPNVGERRVLALEERDDGSIRRVVFYRFGGDLPAAVVRAIGSGVVSWEEVGEFDPATHTWRLQIVPKVFAGRFDGGGSYRFLPDGNGTVREVAVELRVKVPLVGRRVEKAIMDGLKETLIAEAAALEEYVSGGGG